MDKINNKKNNGGKTRVKDKFNVGKGVPAKGELG